MTINVKEESKKNGNGYGKKIKGSLYQIMQERNKNDKRNGEWQESKVQPTMGRTRGNGKK